MAAITGASISFRSCSPQLHHTRATPRSHGLKSVSLSDYGRSSLSFRWQPRPMRLSVCCAAKPETVKKVCDIVRKQLALPDDSKVHGESKFAALGADSLDTVEIVMGLEEEFGISVEEDSAQSITTVQEAADLIEDLVEKNSA
ncbi:hypothetical protein FNV43_RR04831 [Rhamnella rubrinervis]|uniref:Acyl carrier protein n=1 Tax=Rhamnella rubrinervis TaxID=2594499 RepID=A0A8K0MQI0_9ROSA|nr:hypothetical protein FNV43_RR04831 [Rhamnella rubrinervis]